MRMKRDMLEKKLLSKGKHHDLFVGIDDVSENNVDCDQLIAQSLMQNISRSAN